MIKLIKYKIEKPDDQNEEEFINEYTNNINLFVHEFTDDLSVIITYNEFNKLLTIKTLKLNEHTN